MTLTHCALVPRWSRTQWAIDAAQGVRGTGVASINPARACVSRLAYPCFDTLIPWQALALCAVLLLGLAQTRSQLVLDDVADDSEFAAELHEQPPRQQQATNPLTRLLQWGVDNTVC